MIKNIIWAIRSLNQKGRHNYMKILSLAIGFAVGLVLIAKVCFEQSYDNFYPDIDRIYQIHETYSQNNEEERDHQYVPGGTAVRLREIMPEIETATRITFVENGNLTLTENKKKLKAQAALADSCFFDILSRPILQGNAKETLSKPLYVMVSDEIAKNIGGDVIGKTFSFDDNEKVVLTIGGVFKKFPLNSDITYDIFVSMPSIRHFMYDGSLNLIGNDRYMGLIKLRKGADISSVDAQMNKYIETYLPVEKLEKAGVRFSHSFYPLKEMHAKDENIKSMTVMLLLVAFALLFVASMNYILITVSSVVTRSKEIAVRKCYGATGKNISSIILSEAFVHVIIALLIAVMILFTFKGTVERLVGTPLADLLKSGSMWSLTAICLLILLVTGLLPGSLYARIPVAAAFRRYRESKRLWKLGLLFLQFSAATFLVSLLFSLNRQYTLMENDDPGYDYENLAFAAANGLDTAQRKMALQEISRLPEVAKVSYSCTLPFDAASGDNITLPGESRELFNAVDMYYVGEHFLDILGIRIVDGKNFNPTLNADEEIMVSQSFVKKMENTAGWTGSPVGKQVCVTSHNSKGKAQTICGVFEDFRIGTLQTKDDRPIAMFYSPQIYWGCYLIKFHKITPEAIQKVEDTLLSIAPNKEIHVYNYKNELVDSYNNIKNFRDSVLVGGLVILAIVFIGLIGYTTDEVNRRKKEIAIRRINGALLPDVEKVFLMDIVKMAVPAALIGLALAWKVITHWQEQFSEKAPLPWYIFVSAFLLVLAVIFAVSAYNVRRVANDNPVNSLKSE